MPDSMALVNEIEALLLRNAQEPNVVVQRYRLSAARVDHPEWRVLISGLCSVGKSSFICALWGDASLVPTAVRDCTQTNTTLRHSAAQPQASIRYLSYEEALNFARGDLSFYRLQQFMQEAAGSFGPRLEELPARDAIQTLLAWVSTYFQTHPEAFVLNEHLSDELEKLQEFLAFIESPAFEPASGVTVPWAERSRYLMGVRKPDGRPGQVGALLACAAVELSAKAQGWEELPLGSDALQKQPTLVDSPWIPTFKDARRKALILREAQRADALLLLFLPDRVQPEEWVLEAWRARPELVQRTWVIFNQLDTVDPETLFGRGGFGEAFEANLETFGNWGVPTSNLLVSCARLPFLKVLQRNAPLQDPLLESRLRKLEETLARLERLARNRGKGRLQELILQASADPWGGLTGLKTALRELAQQRLAPARRREWLADFEHLEGFGGIVLRPEDRECWVDLRSRLRSICKA